MSLNVADYVTLGERGRLPLCTSYMSNCIKYWLKVIRMQDFRYPKQSYFMLKRLDDVGRKNWASCIRELLYMYGFGYVWIAHDVGNEAYFLNLFKQRIIDSSLQKWHSDINSSSKAVHYRCFKSLLNVESYLQLDISFDLRKILADFRGSGHNLMIEKGRHVNIDKEFRFCPICVLTDIFVVEDEYHFFFECKAYEEIRNTYFKRSWIRNRSLNMFYTIMGLNDMKSILKITTFLKHAFALRTTFLNNI